MRSQGGFEIREHVRYSDIIILSCGINNKGGARRSVGTCSVDVFARLSSEPAGTVRLCPGKVSCDSYLHLPSFIFSVTAVALFEFG